MGLSNVLASLTARLARLFYRPFGGSSAFLTGKPLERQLLIYKLPGAQVVLANDLSVVETLLTDRAGTFPKNTALEMLLRPLIGSGVFGQPGGDAVKQARRLHVRALSRIPDAAVSRISQSLTRRYIAEWQQSAHPVPIPSELSRLSIDIVTEATLGTRFTTEESRRFVALFFEYNRRADPVLLLRGPTDTRIRQAAIDNMELTAIGTEMRVLMRTRFLEPLLAASPGQSDAPLGAALRDRAGLSSGNGATALAPDTQTAMLDEIAVVLLAGHETTASVLSWLLWELAGAPQEQERTARLLTGHAPVAGAVGAETHAIQPDSAQLRLKALIQEALRLYPPIAFLLRETTGDVEFRERPISAGSAIVVSPWTIHRHRGLWRNPDVFDPGRWMAASPPEPMAQRTAFIPFGHGPRICPGKRFAEVEMLAILGELLGTVRLSRTWGRAPRPLGRLTSRPDYDFKLRLAERASKRQPQADS